MMSLTSHWPQIFLKVLIPWFLNELVYSGSKKLTDTIENVELDMGSLVLSPTRHMHQS